jgi:hypothetical protein
MAATRTTKLYAQQLIDLYAKENLKAGEMITGQTLRVRFLSEGGKIEQFNSGMDWLVSRGLLKPSVEEPELYFLTKAGYKAYKL